MKTLKPLALLTPLALLALVSCGGGNSTVSESKEESKESVASSQNEQSSAPKIEDSSSSAPKGDSEDDIPPYKNPSTPEEYFKMAERSQRVTAEKNDIRIYTPHANVSKGIPENGYLSYEYGMTVELDLSSGGEDINSFISGMGLDVGETTTHIGFNAKKIPLDYRDVGRNDEDTSHRVMSFANSIEDTDSNIDVDIAGFKLSNLAMTTQMHLADDMLYVDLSGVNRILSLVSLGNGLPGKGKMAFDVSESGFEFDLFDGIGINDGGDEDNDYELPFDFGDIADLNGLGISDILVGIGDLSLDLYNETDASLWTFGEGSIKFEINSEADLSNFLLDIYKGENENADDDDIRNRSEDIAKALDMMVFDHISTEMRFDENGLVYQSTSFLISSFDKEKIIAEEGADSPMLVYPDGAYKLSYGLAYEYDNVEPETLSTKDMLKYELMDSEEILDDIMDLLRGLLPIGDDD